MKEIIEKEYDSQKFEDIKHIDENGIEFWYAREIMNVLQYSKWQNFEKIINKAMITCENSGISTFEHFVDADKLSRRANNAEVVIKDYKLTRYACYLIIQNGDSRKKVIALAQRYFAIRTRKQEISERELIANLFIISQTEQRLKRDNIQRKEEVRDIHNIVGKIVRNTIKEVGGTMPEDLPTPEKSLKELEKENKKSLLKI